MNKSTLCIIAIVLIILMKPSEILAQPNSTKHTIEKVKTAMLTMQRRSWEQGTAMQGLMAVGDTSLTVLLAHEALVWSKPDGRVAMCGSETNISDPLVNGPGLLFAYKVTGDEKYRAAAEKLYEYAFKPETRTPRGNIRHNSRTMTVWSDNTFMQAPFLAMMGNFDV
jgi:unsaturated rhamnogalacturonyl hydrolase